MPVVVLLVVIAVGVGAFVVLGGDEGAEIEALGSRVGNAAGVLAEAEQEVRDVAEAEDAAVGDDLRCWFSYPSADAAEPNDFLRCGPIVFVDSGPDEIWITVPVVFTAGEDGAIATVEPEFEASSTALDDGEELARPDGGTPPSPDDVDIEPPPPPPAEAGFIQVTEGAPPVDLDERPEDGRLNGRSYRLEVDGFSYTDRVSLAPDEGLSEESDVYGAARGERWLVAQVTLHGVNPDDWNQSAAEFALVVDGRREDLGIYSDSYGEGSQAWTITASVPTDAEEVALVGSEVELEQTWSFVDQRRSDGAPDVLYRDEQSLSTDVNQQFSLPYGIDDVEDYGDVPFGEEQASLSVGGVELNYLVEDGDGQLHTASGPDRALVYLTDVETDLSGGVSSGYDMLPENMVLTLPDGTAIEARRLSEDGSYLLGGFVVWDVPADIQTATITIRPGRGPATYEPNYTYDFRDSEATFEVDFGPA